MDKMVGTETCRFWMQSSAEFMAFIGDSGSQNLLSAVLIGQPVYITFYRALAIEVCK